MKHAGTVWKPEEIEVLMQHKDASTKELMVLIPGRSSGAIAARRHRLKRDEQLKKNLESKGNTFKFTRHPWTYAELQILKEQGSMLTISELEKLIPNHPRMVIIRQVKSMGLTIKPSRLGRRNVFSDQQREYIQYFYPRKGGNWCASALGLNINQVRYLAKRLGVRRNNKK